MKKLILFLAISTSYAFDHTHHHFDSILKRYTIERGHLSYFNYRDLKKNDSTKLEHYLKQLSLVTKNEFEKFNDDEKLSFLINAYNAFTIKLIIDHYPIKSIKDIGSFLSSPWSRKFITLFEEKISLDTIEHELIRKKFNNPMIHFVLVCASKGCPPLQSQAITKNNIELIFQKSVRNFLSDKNKNHYDEKHMRLVLSPIFKWYAEDFLKDGGDLTSWITPFMDDKKVREALRREDVSISYSNYDWSLNEL